MPSTRGRDGLAQEWVPYRAQELAAPAPARRKIRADGMPLEARQWGSGRGRGGWGEGAWTSYSWGWGWVSNGQTSTSSVSTTTKEATSSPDPTTPSTTSSQLTSSNEPEPSTDPSSPPAGSDPLPSDQQAGNQSTTVESGGTGESGGSTTAAAPSHPAAQLPPSPGDSSSSEGSPSSSALGGIVGGNTDATSAASGGHSTSSRTIALVITSVLLLVILLGLLFFLCHRRRKKSDRQTLQSSDVNRDSAVPRPFTQLSSISGDTAEHHMSDMTMIGGPIDKIGYFAAGDIKRGSRGWPVNPVQLSDAPEVTTGPTYDMLDRPSSISSSFISPLTSEAPSYEKRPLPNIAECHPPSTPTLSMSSPVGSEPANFLHETASPDPTTRMLSSQRLTHITHSTRFSTSSGTTLMTSTSRDPQRDRELEELHSAMQRVGLNVQTLLSSLQLRPVHEGERDARPPEYGA